MVDIGSGSAAADDDGVGTVPVCVWREGGDRETAEGSADSGSGGDLGAGDV